MGMGQVQEPGEEVAGGDRIVERGVGLGDGDAEPSAARGDLAARDVRLEA